MTDSSQSQRASKLHLKLHVHSELFNFHSTINNFRKSLPETFLPSMIPEAAKETAMNWFYKVSSIRELLPRLYVEMSLIRCYKFIKPKEIDAALLRLSRMIRGVGDPLVASYARCYLVRVGVQVSNGRDYMKECFLDFLTTYPSVGKVIQ